MGRMVLIVLLCVISWGCALPRAAELSVRAQEMPQIEGHTAANAAVCSSFIPDLYDFGFTITLTSRESSEDTFLWYKSHLETRGWKAGGWAPDWTKPKLLPGGFYWQDYTATRAVYWTLGNSRIRVGSESLEFTIDSQRQFKAEQPGCDVTLRVDTDYFWDWPTVGFNTMMLAPLGEGEVAFYPPFLIF